MTSATGIPGIGPYFILTCDGYQCEERASNLPDAIAACRRIESASADGYARIITFDGRIVADIDGPLPPDDSYIDAATRTGMYDQW